MSPSPLSVVAVELDVSVATVLRLKEIAEALSRCPVGCLDEGGTLYFTAEEINLFRALQRQAYTALNTSASESSAASISRLSSIAGQLREFGANASSSDLALLSLGGLCGALFFGFLALIGPLVVVVFLSLSGFTLLISVCKLVRFRFWSKS